MKRRLITWALALATVSALALPKIWPMRNEGVLPGGTRSTAQPSVPLAVQVVTVRAMPFRETIQATGTLRADEAVELQVETSGKVIAIHFQEGMAVQRGDLLLKINDADLKAMRERALARQRLAEIREGRLASLVKEGGANQQDYDTAVSELQVQGAELSLIDAQIAKTEVRAPFDGIIGLRFVSAGSLVSPTSRIATLQNVDRVKLDFSIPEKYASQVHPGQTVTFTVAGDISNFTGQVYAVEPRIDELTRTLLLRATAPNSEARLRPGAFANITLELARLEDALLVPAFAVIPGLVDKNVFILREGKAVRMPVQLGARTETDVQIVAGVSAGDLLITSGLQNLRPGQAVQPRPTGE